MKYKFGFLLVFAPFLLKAQSTFYKENTSTLSSLPADSVYRTGSVAISDTFQTPQNNKLFVSAKYDSTSNKGAFFVLNPHLQSDDTSVPGLAEKVTESHITLVAQNFANFKDGVTFTDVHNSTAEFGFFRGITDNFGYRDGGDIAKAATLRLAGTFGNNGRDYKTTDFDLLNMRFFTSSTSNNTAKITNFYALRLEDFRGDSPGIITNGWGIYMQPAILKNFFGGMVGVGTNNVTNQLTVSASSDPVKIVGLSAAQDKSLVGIDENGVLHRQSTQNLNSNFANTSSNTTLSDEFFLYIHEGPDATYTLPAANLRTGKTWKIVNIGTGQITLSQPFYEGDMLRNTILNKAGLYTVELFSDGVKYIAIE